MPPVSSLSSRYGLPVSLLSSSLLSSSSSSSSSSKRFTLSAAAIHFLIVFQIQNATAGFPFAAQILSALYERAICQDERAMHQAKYPLCAKPSSCANYERAICQESEAEQAMLCCAVLCCAMTDAVSLLLYYATRLPCPFHLADNHFLLSPTTFSPVCC